MELNIKLEAFEGPLDLLLHMIDTEEIDIYNIPIHKITKEYLSYIGEADDLTMEQAAEFLSMAAILLEIKSKMLLPDAEMEPIILGNEEDPRYELMLKLIEYKKIKKLSKYLSDRDLTTIPVVFSELGSVYKNIGSFKEDLADEVIDVELLEIAFKRVLEKMLRFNEDKKEFFSEIYRENYTVESKRHYIFNKLKQQARIRFNDLFSSSPVIEELVTTFLALLEIIRDKHISIEQEKQFGDIILVRR